MIFVADAHFGEGDAEEEERKEQHFLSFLDSLDPEHDHLVICGDLFDFWFEYRYVVAAQYLRTVGKLADAVARGLRVDYVAGNHDFWLRDFFPNRLGIAVHRKDLTIHHDGVRVYVRHGDGLRRSDYGYRLLKRILQNPVSIAMFRLVHPDLGYAMAYFFAELSRKKDAHPYRELDDSDYVAFADAVLASGRAQLVVLAHTHKRRLLRRPGGVFLNPGDWLGSYTFGELSGGTVSLKQWSLTCGQRGREEALATVSLDSWIDGESGI